MSVIVENLFMKHKRTFRERAGKLEIALLVIIVFAVGFTLGSQFTLTASAQGANTVLTTEDQADFEPLFEVFNLIKQQYIAPPDNDTLVDGAISGMVDALDDQYSGYVSPELYPLIDENLSGSIEGIGVVISEIEDTGEIEVVNVLPNTPAERSGVRVGDVFMLVNDEDVVGISNLELAARVRGPSGTTVDVTMRRGDEMIEFTIERARIEIPNIETDILEGDIAYISMAQFSGGARNQVDDALAELAVNSRNGLIFDLRGNPGGLLTTATEIAGLFIEDGIILIEEFGGGEERIFKVEDGTVFEVFSSGDERVYSRNAAYAGVEVPVVVLVDRRSASASELVAGAWKDSGAVTLLGTTTFGKGTVQIQNALVNGGGIRLTIARWLTPEGLSISDLGVEPDIVVEIPDDAELEEGEDPQLEAALEFLREAVTVQEVSAP
jgi:carboxyl-terminal processing protease